MIPAPPRVAAVLPALDEEESIGDVLRAIDREVVGQLVVGDNGSRDRTVAIARASGAEVVDVAARGYGAACAGALERLAPEVEVVVFLDADGADDPAQIPDLLAPIVRGDADLVIGSRVRGLAERGALSPQQRFGNWLATRLIHLFFGHRYSDLGPFRAIRRDLLDAIAMRDRRYGWTVEMQIRALQLGARVREVPVRYRRRRGRSKISGTLGGCAKAGYWILRTIFVAAMLRRRSDPQWGRACAPGRPAPAPSRVLDRSS